MFCWLHGPLACARTQPWLHACMPPCTLLLRPRAACTPAAPRTMPTPRTHPPHAPRSAWPRRPRSTRTAGSRAMRCVAACAHQPRPGSASHRCRITSPPAPALPAPAQADWKRALATTSTLYVGNLSFYTREEQVGGCSVHSRAACGREAARRPKVARRAVREAARVGSTGQGSGPAPCATAGALLLPARTLCVPGCMVRCTSALLVRPCT